MASEKRPRGLLVDYGGVLTTNLFDSFRAFCGREGLAPDALLARLRESASARAMLYALEEGRMAEDQFESSFAGVLGVTAERLIDRLFAGAGPDETMMGAVAAARAAGIRTGLISN